MINYTDVPRSEFRWSWNPKEDYVVNALGPEMNLVSRYTANNDPPEEIQEFSDEDLRGMNMQQLRCEYSIGAYEYMLEIIESRPPSEPQTPEVSETRAFNPICPICQSELVVGQYIAKYRCGHLVCNDCYDGLVDNDFHSCTLCSRSTTARQGFVDKKNLQRQPRSLRRCTRRPPPRSPAPDP